MIKTRLNKSIIIALFTVLIIVLILTLLNNANHTNHTDDTPLILKNIEKEKKYGQVVNIWDVNYITIKEAEYLPLIQRTRFNLYGVDTIKGDRKSAIKYMADTILGKDVAYTIIVDPITKNYTNNIFVYLPNNPELPSLNIILIQKGFATTKNLN